MYQCFFDRFILMFMKTTYDACPCSISGTNFRQLKRHASQTLECDNILLLTDCITRDVTWYSSNSVFQTWRARPLAEVWEKHLWRYKKELSPQQSCWEYHSDPNKFSYANVGFYYVHLQCILFPSSRILCTTIV